MCARNDANPPNAVTPPPPSCPPAPPPAAALAMQASARIVASGGSRQASARSRPMANRCPEALGSPRDSVRKTRAASVPTGSGSSSLRICVLHVGVDLRFIRARHVRGKPNNGLWRAMSSCPALWGATCIYCCHTVSDGKIYSSSHTERFKGTCLLASVDFFLSVTVLLG